MYPSPSLHCSVRPRREASSVCILVTKASGGGAERAMTLLASEFARGGLHTTLLSIQEKHPNDYALAADVHFVTLGRKKASGAVVGLVHTIRRLRPTWLVSASLNTDLFVLALRPLLGIRLNILCSLQNNLSALLEAEAARGRGFMARHAIKLYRSADRLTAISHGVAVDAGRHLGPRTAVDGVIPNPLDLSAIDRLRTEPPPAPMSEQEGPWVLAAGRLTAQKDYPTLLEAFRLARTEYPALRLAVLGEGPDRAKLECLAADLAIHDYVHFLGFVRNPYAAMAHARVFVLSSRYEGFGNVLAEALACGTEVVSTDCPFGPREILDGGRLGRLVPVGDPRAMATAILEALRVRRRDPAPVRAWVERYALPAIARAYLEVMGVVRQCA